MEKLFVNTLDHDQFRITFDEWKEKQVFQDVLNKMADAVLEHIIAAKKEVYKGFKFKTTLEYQVASEHSEDLRKALALNVLNIVNKDSVIITKRLKKE